MHKHDNVAVPETYQIWTTIQNLKNGQIKNPYKRTVFDRGYYGVGSYTARINNHKTEQYIKWFSMFNRCYNPKVHKQLPRYTDCTVSEEFYNFQNFAQWYDRKKYPSKYKLELDKDLFIKGNKEYSPKACCLLPKPVNNALIYKREDIEYMNDIYQAFKRELPNYIVQKLFALSQGQE